MPTKTTPMAVSSRRLTAPGQPADAERGGDPGDQPAEEQIGAEDVGDGDAGQNRMREGVAEERHAAHDDEAADHAADRADHQRRQHGALHELVGQGLDEQLVQIHRISLEGEECEHNHSASQRECSVLQCSSTTKKLPFSEDADVTAVGSWKFSGVKTSAGVP